jgi:TPR repeat protein
MAWLTRAAENGHAYAAYALARIHQGSQPGVLDMLVVQYLGPGQHVYDPDKSLFWLRKAINGGFREPAALRLLGEMSFLSRSFVDAARLFRQAADAGDEKAQLWLAVLYYHGYGVGRDLAAAAQWTRKSADNGGTSGALYALGILYDRGDGVAQDREESRRWMKKAVARGYLPAIRYLSWPRWKFWARRPGFPETLA